MTQRRKRLVTALSGLALAGSFGLVYSGPAQAEPDIGDVETRVDRLYHEAEQASERYNDAKLELDALRDDVDSLQADESQQDEALSDVRENVKDSIVRQYQGQSLTGVGEVVVSDDAGSFLSQMSTMSAFDAIQQGLFADYATGLKALGIREAATSKRLDQVAKTEERLAEEKATIDDRLAKAESLLDRLEAEERESVVSRGTERAPAPGKVPASGSAGAAVQYAMAQIGDAYVYGAAGPNAFDCSGFTMMAWAQAGVSLPHSSSAQYSSGARVAESDLRPGDLVFYYSPISHVGMYIGNGQIAHAANPGTGVAVASLHSMPYVGAVRPG